MEFKAKASEKSKHFISLKDGDEVTGVFLGSPFEYHVHWDKASNRSSLCKGAGCEMCAEGNKKKFRFRLNMAVKGDNGPEVKILENGFKLYRALGVLNEEYPLDEGFTKVKRSGSSMNDTTYSVVPIIKEKLTEATLAKLKALELLPVDPTDPFWNSSDDESEGEEESVPF